MTRVERSGAMFTYREQRAIRKFLSICEEIIATQEEQTRMSTLPPEDTWILGTLRSAAQRRHMLRWMRRYVGMAAKPKTISPQRSKAKRKAR